MAAATNKSLALIALTQAAMALPSVASAEGVEVGYLFSEYREQDISGSRTATGRDESRYDIQSHLFKIVAPLEASSVNLDLTYETMSGASPWYVTPGTDGKPVQVMSGASIREERVDIQGKWSKPIKDVLVGLTAGYSTEDDYEAVNGGIEFEIENESKTLTWSGGIGYSDDKLDPTEGGSTRFPTRITEADRQTWTLYGGAALVIDANTVVQGSLSYSDADGYLSDPYKLAWIQSFSNVVNDSRPDGRKSVAIGARLRHKVEAANAALHVDYRFHDDDWEMQSHTLEAAWYQRLGDSWTLTPTIRWYSQSQAFFYEPYYAAPRADGFASSDYRLSPFGALSGRIDVSKAIGAWNVAAGVEYYQADKRFALENVGTANPGLVEYTSLQIRVRRVF